jgi:phosphoglycolate phosphatase-like HAD superfamily hydrolase
MILRYLTTGKKTDQSFSVMNINNKKPIIALDCDGVLLDYHAAYAQIYQQTFGKELTVVSPNAYRVRNIVQNIFDLIYF